MKPKWLVLSLVTGMFFTMNDVAGQKIDLNKAGKTVKNVSDNKKDKKDKNTENTTTTPVSTGSSSSGTSSDKNESLIGTPQHKRQEALAEEALALIEDGKMEAGMAKLQEAHDACPTCPDAAEMRQILGLKEQMGQVEDAKYTCNNLIKDDGFSSPTHSQYVKKIVFAKTEIVKGKENTALFTNSFTLADDIYSRIYVEKSAGNEAKSIGLCNSTPVFVRYTINDGKTTLPADAGSNPIQCSGSDDFFSKVTTWQLEMSPSAADVAAGEYPKSGIQNFYDKMFYLPEGTHKVKIELILDIPEDRIGSSDVDSYMYTTKFGPEKVLASGEFNITVKNSDKAALKKKLNAMSKEEKDAAAEAEYKEFMRARSSNTGSSSSGTSVIVKNNSTQPVYIAKYNSETSNSTVSSGEAIYGGSSMTIDGSFYPKITVTGACSGTFLLKDKGGQTIVICK